MSKKILIIPSRCVCCGEEVPEGRMVCLKCEEMPEERPVYLTCENDSPKRNLFLNIIHKFRLV